MAREWIQAKGADASGAHQSDVPILNIVCGDGFTDGLIELINAKWGVKVQKFSRLVHSLKVGSELEDSPVVNANPLKAAIAVEQPVVEHADSRILDRHQRAIDPDLP